ncbi:hypothetical protein R5R35_004168 [Gryllus longicercus]|uniref:UBX domain-containing protein 11 n=1 Tax=Gryllus longicercus TaxID=2509291 RepID=A0AAN9VGE9_9ORTH
MESLIYKENVSRLPPLSHRKRESRGQSKIFQCYGDFSFPICERDPENKNRTKISSAANIKSPTNKMYDSLEIPHDSCRNSKSSGSRSYVRSNMNYNTPNPSSPNAEESCQHLSYVILQQLASTEHQNALIHDKLVYNEQKMGSVVEEVSRLKKKISDLEEMLQIQSEKNCCCSSGNGCKQLQEKCNQFEQKIKSLEELLAQHNSKSEGNDWNSSLQNSSSKLENCIEKDNQVSVWTSDSSMPSNSSIDFGKLLQAVQELNLIAGQGESKMCYTKSGATFQRSAGIPLTLYANGLILNNGSYRSYDDDSTQQFLQDILDGYFPSEFQNDYPDGVPLHVEDKHHINYEAPKQTWSAFSGKGYRLGNGTPKNNTDKPTPSRLLQEYSKPK